MDHPREKHQWFSERILQMKLGASNGVGTSALAQVWERLPNELQLLIRVCEQSGRYREARLELLTGTDEIVFRQVAPLKAGVTITRNEQHLSIVGVYEDGEQREVTMAFSAFSAAKLDALVQHFADPVIFGPICARCNLLRWESLAQQNRKALSFEGWG